jgi:hypothetical protein
MLASITLDNSTFYWQARAQVNCQTLYCIAISVIALFQTKTP